jgi:hypothetical protein
MIHKPRACRWFHERRVAKGSTTLGQHVPSVLVHTYMLLIMMKCELLSLAFPILTLPARFLDRITSGEIKVTANQFPNFLYDESEAQQLSEENPEEWDVEKGLLRSSLCLWVSFYKNFMSFSYWLGSYRRSNAYSWVTVVLPRLWLISRLAA